MQDSRIYLVFSLCLHFCGMPSCVYCAKQLCPYTPQNIDQAYRHCCAISHTTGFNLDSKHGDSERLDSQLTSAFLSYCSQVPEINSCVLGLLTSRECDQALFQLYLSWASKSNSLCGTNGSLCDEIMGLFNVSSFVNLDAIDRCKPSHFDFHLCKRLADRTRNREDRNAVADTVRRETEYLLDLSLCVYSSVFVGCPSDTAILTLLYEIEEWLPPRLGANATEVLRVLCNRDMIFN